MEFICYPSAFIGDWCPEQNLGLTEVDCLTCLLIKYHLVKISLLLQLRSHIL